MFDTKKINEIKDLLLVRKETVAVTESVTAGFLQAALASAEEAMRIFQGGMSLYNIGQKCRHLDIDPIHAIASNCVSERISAAMAKGISERFTSDWGIAITGYATRVPEAEEKVFAFFSITFHKELQLTGRLDAGERLGHDAQLFYVESMLTALLNLLHKM